MLSSSLLAGTPRTILACFKVRFATTPAMGSGTAAGAGAGAAKATRKSKKTVEIKSGVRIMDGRSSR
jgi:hypothetical protein